MIKNILPLLFFIVLSYNTYSQKCEIQKDPFTNEQIVSFDFRAKTVCFQLKNERVFFEIVFHYWGERDHEFKEGTEVLLKLENGNKMGLKTINTSRPKIEQITSSSGYFPGYGGGMTMSSSENFTAYSFTFSLTPTELNKLADSKIEVIRIPDTDEGKYVDLEAKKKTKKKLKAVNKGAICLSENL
ncbi:MAG: hypothetical protein O2U61_06920 [Candidatus Bathyarchaeota archaeon]|nr:hypothetical protein [Candidatus Bathyarchaeota archaeon]